MKGLLKGKKFVLDLGCGALKWVPYCDDTAAYCGIDLQSLPVDQWARRTREREGPTMTIEGNILNFDRILHGSSWGKPDAIILMDSIEHLNKQSGVDLLDMIETAYPDAMIAVFTPWGFQPNGEFQDTPGPMQHLSGWDGSDFSPPWFCTDLANFHGEGKHAMLAVKR